MLRRHVTPALLVFVSSLVICLARPLVRDAWLSLLPFVSLPAAAAVAALHHGTPRAGILLASFCVGSLLGVVSLARMSNSDARSFLPAAGMDITGFVGAVTEDSSLSQKGYTVVRMSLEAASSLHTGVSGQARGAVLLLVPGDYRFSLGQIVSCSADLVALDNATGTERWVSQVERRNIRLLGYSSELWRYRSRAREWLHRSLSSVGYPDSSLLEALLIGGREDVPQDLYAGFQKTGSLHILALSGMHVTLLYGLVAGLLFFLRDRRVKFALVMAVLLAYQFLAGFMPSLLRATVMIFAGGLGLAADRDREGLNLLSLAGIVLLLIDPFAVFSISFQLSFLAIAGMLTLGTLIARPLTGRIPPVVLTPLSLSLGAQAATLPLVIAQFGAYYPSGIVAGLILVPLTTAYLVAGLAWLPVSVIPWHVLQTIFAQAIALLYGVIQSVIVFFARMPGVSFAPPARIWFPLFSALVAFAAAALLPLRRGGARVRCP